MQNFKQTLNQNWSQQIKPTSQECIAPKGATTGAVNANKWKIVQSFNALGVHIQDNNETDLVRLHTRKVAVTKFYKIAKTADYKTLACRNKIRILNVQILPYISYRLTPLPMSATLVVLT